MVTEMPGRVEISTYGGLMRNIKLIYHYDGSGVNGFQKQTREGTRTVQGELEKTLESFPREPIETATAGRTDTGVHAVDQVVSFKTESAMSTDTMRNALNILLPQSTPLTQQVLPKHLIRWVDGLMAGQRV